MPDWTEHRRARDFVAKPAWLPAFETVSIVNRRIAIAAADHYQTPSACRIAIRKTIDTLIATRCTPDGIPPLYSDRDFDPFVEHIGLRSALDIPGVS